MARSGSSNGSKSRRTFLKLSGASVAGVTSLAGCSGGSGGGSSNGDARDFGGQELNLVTNVGAMSNVHQQYLVPKVEEKYNLNINVETAVTSAQLTQLETNPEDPPDIIMPDVIGVDRAARNGWLEPLTDHTDIVPAVDNIYDKFVHYDGAGVSWEVGECLPVINTDLWDSTPTSYSEIMTEANSTARVPFSWSGGPYLLLMASAIATGEAFGSRPDVEPGFQWLEENFAPNVQTSYQGVASAKQKIASESVDTITTFWDYMVFDMVQNDSPIKPIFRPDPTGIAFAQCVAVPSETDNMDAALTFANECLSAEFQETASENIGSGVTNENAEIAEAAIEFGATKPGQFDQLTFPDFEYIWENRSDWSQRWNEVFSN